MKKQLVCGAGINDLPHVLKKCIKVNGEWKAIWHCPYYVKWQNVVIRCFSDVQKKRQPTYKDCTIDPDWLYASKFKAWMEKQDWEGKELDKDLLIKGNKHYGPETCLFINKRLNNFLTDRVNYRGDWPIGVTWHKSANCFVAQCSDPFKRKVSQHLGCFTCPHEAHRAWLAKKHEYACELAGLETDIRIIEALRTRYYDLSFKNSQEDINC